MRLEPSTSSGLLSSSTSVTSVPTLIHGVTLLQASAACTCIVYDNATTNSGTVVAQVNNTANTTTVYYEFTTPIRCLKGAYVALTGTGANAILHYATG